MKTINENGTFRKRFPEWKFLKTLFSRVRVDRRKRNFSKALRTHYQFQSSPRNIRNLFKVADGRFPFLSFIECFHSRGQHLCKFIGTDESVCIRKEFTSQKIGLGHQHDRRFIVLGYQPTPKKFKEGANLLFRGLIIANTYASSVRNRLSYHFQIDLSYSYTQAKTMPKSYEGTRIFFENGEKKLRFQTNTDTCGHGLNLLVFCRSRVRHRLCCLSSLMSKTKNSLVASNLESF